MLCTIMYYAVKQDLKCREIPDECSLAICIMAVGAGGFNLCRLCCALGILILSAVIIGFGDAKLFASLTLLLGKAVLNVIMLSFILSGLYCSISIIKSRLKGMEGLNFSDSIPFAPFIALASIGIYTNIVFHTIY